jgi:hypothetical protein
MNKEQAKDMVFWFSLIVMLGSLGMGGVITVFPELSNNIFYPIMLVMSALLIYSFLLIWKLRKFINWKKLERFSIFK